MAVFFSVIPLMVLSFYLLLAFLCVLYSLLNVALSFKLNWPLCIIFHNLIWTELLKSFFRLSELLLRFCTWLDSTWPFSARSQFCWEFSLLRSQFCWELIYKKNNQLCWEFSLLRSQVCWELIFKKNTQLCWELSFTKTNLFCRELSFAENLVLL